MAHWGVAYAIGPNYNKPWDDFEPDEKPEALTLAQNAVTAALAQIDAVTPVERALIEALQKRCPENRRCGLIRFMVRRLRICDAQRA